MSPAAERVLERLEQTRQKWWIFSLLTTGTLGLSASIGVFVLFMLLDAVFIFPQWALGVMLLVWAILSVVLAATVFARVMRNERSLVATARCIEAQVPEIDSELINLVQLAHDEKNENRAFRDAAVAGAAMRLAGVPFEDAAKHESRWRRFRYRMQTVRDFAESALALLLVVVAAIACHVLLPNWSSAANRLMTPWEFTPSVGTVQITVTPGDAEILVGESLDITAEIVDPTAADEPLQAALFVTREGEDEEAIRMTPGEQFIAESASGSGDGSQARRKYELSLPANVKDFTYRVEIGDSQSPAYRVAVLEKPAVEQVEIIYHFPPYLQRDPETVVQRSADLEAPIYTRAELRIRPTVAITSGRLDWEGGGITGSVEEDGRLLVAEMTLTKNTTFTIDLRNGELTDAHPRLNTVRVLPDRPPTIELLKPTKKTTAAPGDEIGVMMRAADDHGLGRIQLQYKVKPTATAASGASSAGVSSADLAAMDVFGSDAAFSSTAETMEASSGGKTVVDPQTELQETDVPVRTIESWSDLSGEKTAVKQYRLQLTEELATPGNTVYVRAVAWDKRRFTDFGLDLGPQESASGWKAIEIVDEQEAVDQTLAKLDNLRGEVFKILEKQIRAQAHNALIARRDTVEDARLLATSVRAMQVDIQKSSIELVKAIDDTERRERLAIKSALNALAFGDMIEAVQLGDQLAKAHGIADFAEPSSELYETQSRIIDGLRAMLNIARRAQTEELSEMEHRSEGDLPDDAKQKLDALNEALEEALEAQRKVIEASENLAKAPVEDFAEEEEQLVKALEAAEDAWEKFMKELNTDLSKLPEQDFANPSMLKELVEIQTEIKMAEGALLEKTKDIAVPLEQLGAEMAEEITTNMEKWLPDTPDRERWSQEESLTDEGKEAPMAELPGELEDLIGELMEEEEDLFDEMEDVSSSAADSLDKGAGWDVADGPISSMSAKGATGNRLPNTSEIGGRAGEGRQGKSSGEFVGDEAIGKGGRNTPARLTPDPYVKGQIKDHSKDPTGGATGGGKESGEGGEGLEGPQPGSRGERDTNRLAGKQGELRNKAEGIDLQHFKVMGYHHQDLQEMIEVMSQVERDLKAGRYENALRQRSVLAEGLGRAKEHLEGDFEVRQDATVNLPTDIHKEILGSMGDDSPAGWEDLNRQYFERLSTGSSDLSGE